MALLIGWLVLSRIGVVALARMLNPSVEADRTGGEQTIVIGEHSEDKAVAFHRDQRSIKDAAVSETLSSCGICRSPRLLRVASIATRSLVRTIDLSAGSVDGQAIAKAAERVSDEDGLRAVGGSRRSGRSLRWTPVSCTIFWVPRKRHGAMAQAVARLVE